MRQAAVLFVVLAACGTADATGIPTQVGGAVRKTGPAWSVIADQYHIPVGAGPVVCDAATGDLTVYFKDPLTRIVRAWSATDETLSRLGIAAGASVSLDRVVLSFTQGTAAVPCDSTLLEAKWGNIWFGIDGYR